ncbi:MAG: hypothetical protein DI603_12495 [Roseateles depolymerans]|uniref:CheW-like domain-containing protein n=1 Tax=Roseateles depolymerans TaxID=76731 RepID=A0A2W5DR82_9BURK|nr:MAG: hypothetical protein DI603_12495 [Roseateles depolymerans]
MSAGLPATVSQWVVARLGRITLAVDARWVEGAQHASAPLTELPRRRGPLAGLLPTVLGLVPVVDLARWVRMKPADAAAQAAPDNPAEGRPEPYYLLLREGEQRLGVRVDALLGVRHLGPECLQRVHQQDDEEELFDAVLMPGDDDTPLCVLEPQRAMQLLSVWMDAADRGNVSTSPSSNASTGTAAAASAGAGTEPAVPLALLRVGGRAIAVESACVAELFSMPALSTRLPGGRASIGFAPWRGRTLPVLDPAWLLQLDEPVDGAPLALVLRDAQDRHLLLPVDELVGTCTMPAELTPPAADAPAWRGRRWNREGELVEQLCARTLLELLPEASLAQPGAGAAAQRPQNTNTLPHMLLHAGRPFAVPATDLLAVVEAPANDLAVLSWRDRQLPVRALPGADQGRLLAVVDSGDGCTALRIDRLLGLLPAHAAERSPLPGRPGAYMLSTAAPRASYVVRSGRELALDSVPVG